MLSRPSCWNLTGRTLLLSYLCVCGCNSADDGKRAVSGSVRYADALIESGEIRFFPIQGTQGTVTGTQIRAGQFELPREKGLVPGTYRIEVVGYRNRDGSPGQVDLLSAEADYVQYVPARYNKSSHETVNVEAGGTPLALELALAR